MGGILGAGAMALLNKQDKKDVVSIANQSNKIDVSQE